MKTPLVTLAFRLSANPEEFDETTDQFSFKKMLPRDERRFKRADLDGDSAANREEFTSFLHPEEFEHMKDIVVLVSPCDDALIKTFRNTRSAPVGCVGRPAHTY